MQNYFLAIIRGIRPGQCARRPNRGQLPNLAEARKVMSWVQRLAELLVLRIVLAGMTGHTMLGHGVLL